MIKIIKLYCNDLMLISKKINSMSMLTRIIVFSNSKYLRNFSIHIQNYFKMIEYIITVLLLITLLLYIWLIYLPRRNLLWHKTVYEALGYKVKTEDFRLFNIGFFLNYLKWDKQYCDPNYKLRTEEYTKYDIVLNNALTKTEVTLMNPDLLKEYFTLEKVYILPKSKIGVANLKRALGNGIVFAQGDTWKRKKKIITQVFNHQILVANIPKMIQIIQQAFQKAEKNHGVTDENNIKSFKIDLNEFFQQAFSQIMIKIFFGHDLKQKKVNNQDPVDFIRDLEGCANKQSFQLLGAITGPWIYNLGLTKKHRELNHKIQLFINLARQFLNERLAQIKQNGVKEKSSNITEQLYKYQKQQHKESQDVYDFQELIDEFRTFLSAGSDTTINLTKVMIYYAVLNPSVEKALREEIDLFIKNDSDITYQNLKKMEYIDCLQKQVVRYYGPVNTNVPRIATVDNKINDLPIRKGDIVNYVSLPIHFNPKFYKNPEQFRPQRWKTQCKNIHPYALVGFSGGPRSCIGRVLALLQNKIAIIKFMKRYNSIKLPCSKINYTFHFLIEPVDMEVTIEKN